MQQELPYTSSIKDMPLVFPDMKRTALLLCEGKSGDEIVRLSVKNSNSWTRAANKKHENELPSYSEF